MRIQLRSLIAAFVAVSVCCGTIGCTFNGGSKFKPSSYSFNNPFKKNSSNEDEFGFAAAEDSSGKLPSSGQKPDLDIPPGEYSTSKTSTPKSVASTNTPSSSTASSVASSGIPRTGTPTPSYSTPAQQQPSVAMNQTPGGYSNVYPPSGTQQAGANMQTPNAGYAGNYQQASATGSYHGNYGTQGSYSNAPAQPAAAMQGQYSTQNSTQQQPYYGSQPNTMPQQQPYYTNPEHQQQPVYPTQNNGYSDPYSTTQTVPATGTNYGLDTTQSSYSQGGYNTDYRPGSSY